MPVARKLNSGPWDETTAAKPKSAAYRAKRRALAARLKTLRKESEALSISAGQLLDRLTT